MFIVLLFARQVLGLRDSYRTAKQLHTILKKPLLDGIPVHDRIFFSPTKCRNLMKIVNTGSLHSNISSLKRSFTAS
jgi:hypothetical protein